MYFLNAQSITTHTNMKHQDYLCMTGEVPRSLTHVFGIVKEDHDWLYTVTNIKLNGSCYHYKMCTQTRTFSSNTKTYFNPLNKFRQVL